MIFSTFRYANVSVNVQNSTADKYLTGPFYLFSRDLINNFNVIYRCVQSVITPGRRKPEAFPGAAQHGTFNDFPINISAAIQLKFN